MTRGQAGFVMTGLGCFGWLWGSDEVAHPSHDTGVLPRFHNAESCRQAHGLGVAVFLLPGVPPGGESVPEMVVGVDGREGGTRRHHSAMLAVRS